MNIEEIRDYCLLKNHVTEGFPFDDTTLVFKVMNKMFALLNLKEDHSINLKCDPDKAIELRSHYDFVLPGYHMNKKHWNTVRIDGSLEDGFVRQLIDMSYEMVVKSLTKKQRTELELEQ